MNRSVLSGLITCEEKKIVTNVSLIGNPTKNNSATVHLTLVDEITTCWKPFLLTRYQWHQDPSQELEKHRWSGSAFGKPHTGLSGSRMCAIGAVVHLENWPSWCSGVCIISRMGPARRQQLDSMCHQYSGGGWVGAQLLTVRGMCPLVVERPSNAKYLPAGMNAPKWESGQCGMWAPSDKHSYMSQWPWIHPGYNFPNLCMKTLGSIFASSTFHINNLVVWKTADPPLIRLK